MAETKEQIESKKRSGWIAFRGTGPGLLGFSLLLLVSSALLFIPLPFVTTGLRKWFYRNLEITHKGQRVAVSFDGRGIDLLKYWIPSLALLTISAGALYWGIEGKADGFMTFLLIVISVASLIPLAWLWTAKKRYTVAHTRVAAGTATWQLSFSGRGATALWHGMKGIFSLCVMALPLPWAIVGALKWNVESTEIGGKDTSFKATFSGTGASLFWYGIGISISPLFLFLILPALLRGLIAWAARFVNIVGLQRTIEFEFRGVSGPLFGYVYLTLAICIGALILNYVLGRIGVPEGGLFAAVVFWFVITVPFVKASFLRWCASKIDIVEK